MSEPDNNNGVKRIPIDTPKGDFRVWTKCVGDNPRIKVLLCTVDRAERMLFNADVHAKVGGLAWLAIGAIVLPGLRLTGRTVDLKLEPNT